MDPSSFFSTPPPPPSHHHQHPSLFGDATPIGDPDRSPKIQLCLELRRPATAGNKRKQTTTLEVTVLWVRHLPVGRPPSSVRVKKQQPDPFDDNDPSYSRVNKHHHRRRRPEPSPPTTDTANGKTTTFFVRLSLLQSKSSSLPTVIHTTEQKTPDRKAIQYIETFKYDEADLRKTLQVSVCQSNTNKSTRNAALVGKVDICLGDFGLRVGAPRVAWFPLDVMTGDCMAERSDDHFDAETTTKRRGRRRSVVKKSSKKTVSSRGSSKESSAVSKGGQEDSEYLKKRK